MFVPRGRYHVMLSGKIGNVTQRIPLFLSFNELVSGALPRRLGKANISVFGPIGVVANPRSLSSKSKLGAGWSFQRVMNNARLTYTAGPLQRDFDVGWDVQTRGVALTLMKQVLTSMAYMAD